MSLEVSPLSLIFETFDLPQKTLVFVSLMCMCVQRVHCKDQPTSQHYLHCTVSVCGWSVAERVSFGTLQGWLIPEHGWLEARGGSVGE